MLEGKRTQGTGEYASVSQTGNEMLWPGSDSFHFHSTTHWPEPDTWPHTTIREVGHSNLQCAQKAKRTVSSITAPRAAQ